MKKQDYSATIVAKTTAEEAFRQITRVSAWWTENLEGSSDTAGGVFTVHFGEAFVAFKNMEFLPGKKISWLVTDCYLHWLNDKHEWTGTTISFEITEENGDTRIDFTHIGLEPQVECYDMCVKGWDQYIKDSLYKLVTEGRGAPQGKTKTASVA